MIKRSYKLTTVIGIPIRMHLTLVIALFFVALTAGFRGILFAAGLLVSIALHELGHSWVAIRKGCRVHEIMLLPIGGIAKMSHIPSRPKDEALIAIAGPLTGLVLSIVFWQLAHLGIFAELFFYLALFNFIISCCFNLLPSFPMDGGRIFRAFMTPRIGRLKATALAARIGRILAVTFGAFSLFSGLPFSTKLLHIFLATFIYNAAGAEYRAVYAQHMSQEWFTVEPQADIHVSPPPYARKAPPFWKEWTKKTNSFFNDLFKNWE